VQDASSAVLLAKIAEIPLDSDGRAIGANAAKGKSSASRSSLRPPLSPEKKQAAGLPGGGGGNAFSPKSPELERDRTSPLKLPAFAASSSSTNAHAGQGAQLRSGMDTPALLEGGAVAYPQNVTLIDMARFITFPTLCYQTSYPRTDKIRWGWVAKRCVEAALCLALMVVIAEQFAAPIMRDIAAEARKVGGVSQLPLQQLAQALVRMTIPCTYLWLCMFYAAFHLALNIIAEVTRFGDRLFYRDWWNATRLDTYWRTWNLPVHNWLVRHVFFPARNLQMGKSVAQLAVFTASAVLHEIVVSVPCRTVRLYAFFGMMAQIPMIVLTLKLDAHKWFKGSQIGNVIFWTSFCIVGQPLCIILYGIDWMEHESLAAAAASLASPSAGETFI